MISSASMSIVDHGRRRADAEKSQAFRSGQSAGRRGANAADAIDVDDEFEGDDLLLDDEAEQSLLQLEQSFHQTQRDPRSQASQINKRQRSPSIDVGAEADLANTTNLSRQRRREDNGSSSRDVLGGATSMNVQQVQELLKQLQKKDAEISTLKTSLRTKEGENKMIRENFQTTVSEYSSMFRDHEEALRGHRSTAQQLKQANEELIAENKTLKSFRSFEANTNSSHQVWSSVSASVARRRAAQTTAGRTMLAGANASGMRDFSQSHSQNVAAAVGLTTPTRRNRGATGRNLGSPSTTHKEDSSPSSQRAHSTRKSIDGASTTKKPAFPGFVNSFAKPLLVKETQRNSVANRATANIPDEEIFLDNDRSPPASSTPHSSSPPSRDPSTSQSAMLIDAQGSGALVDVEDDQSTERRDFNAQSSRPSGWSDPQMRYLWAVKTYSQRQGFLASLVLASSSEPCPQVSPSGQDQHKASTMRLSTSTLQRLLHNSLPNDCSPTLRDEYDLAAHDLLENLSHGTSMDAEDRFGYLLCPFDYELDDEILRNAEAKSSHDDEALWACLHAMNDGVDDVLEGVATSLRVMMGAAYKIGEFERVYDVLILLRTIALHHPTFTRFIASPIDTLSMSEEGKGKEEEKIPSTDDDDDDDVQMNETQHDAAASLKRRQIERLELQIDRLAIGCVRFACSGVDQNELKTSTQSSPTIKTMLLDAVIGLLELLVLETLHNDASAIHCTHALKKVLDQPGLLTSLLDGRLVAPHLIRRTMAILTFMCQHDSLWRIALACRPDDAKPRLGRNVALASVTSDETVLFETLAKLLVDRRLEMSDEQMHKIHVSVLIFFFQLACCRSDEGISLIASSGAVLAMVIKCLQLDTDMLWNYEADGREETIVGMTEAVDRVALDIRFMALIFGSTAKHEQLLSRNLAAPETQLLLNGIRHYFIVALSRVAFASEPSWMESKGQHQQSMTSEERKRCHEAHTLLNEVNDVAAELLELVLSPDEIESCWEALAEDEDEDEDLDEEEEERMEEA